METVTNVVNAASEAIWGKQPTAEEQAAHNETGGEEPISGVKGAGSTEEPFDKGNEATSATTPATTTLPSTSGTADPIGTYEAGTTKSTMPDSSNFLKLQGTENPTPAPTATDIETAATKSDLAESVPTSKSTTDPEPLPLIAHEGGGEHGKETGTGEQYVKSTGVSATGGDFDATNPGASKEATRLLEQTDVKTDSASPATPEVSSSAGETSEPKKVSKLGKLKDKLHIGSGKHN